MNKKFIYTVIATIFLIGAIIGYNYYQRIFGKAITKDMVLFVYATDSLLDVKDKLADYSKNPSTFLLVAAQKNFSKPKSGRYLLKEGMSNNELVNMLRIGNQTALSLSFNNQDTLEKFAGRIAEQLEVDSLSILNSFTDTGFLSENKLTKKSVLQICIPNSYQIYWNVSANGLRDKLLTEYHRFWTISRLEKAKKLKMTKEQVIALASIVQKETAKNSERPIVAGLYLNRLKDGWPLQADPTVIYSIREIKGQDYAVKRVLTADLEIDSPYNTYKNKGLPPTLIAMPDISSIDAVLNPDTHNYMYMCASVEKIGFHAFAKTLAQHNNNAAKYHVWMNKQGVNR
ncbi:endolytic transglycosylase MltG [Polaribacter glomeratus]|uniref:Endolytic murein transglycosylase n=1 Tax=Polaribacter glomeratus TaxID=102 RepID=A0A2S7WXN6_9FLAO|nr:endolytic transglycosylase MltG [Polaribacter glomeratus]PQJ82337.1 aminodeoxychorismate lyase [Polaribacter glomeratus]TXD64564.1 endolytic transglycosylase MltG [Polaribacter glomeratus]